MGADDLTEEREKAKARAGVQMRTFDNINAAKKLPRCRHGYVPADACVTCNPRPRERSAVGLDGEVIVRKGKPCV
jgi:hypothetical protein